MNIIGERLKILRAENNLSQNELGFIMGVGDGMVDKFENGESIPRKSSLFIISRHFEVNYKWLIDSDPAHHRNDYHSIDEFIKGIELEILSDREVDELIDMIDFFYD